MSGNHAVIISARRSPLGAFSGSLSTLPAPKIAAQVLRAVLTETRTPAESVQEVIMGQVLGAGVGQAPARQALIFADLPRSIPALTINKVCGSGLKAVMLARQSILNSDTEVVLAGGMESMSQAPYLLPKLRTGARMGHDTCIDAMVHDGLWDPYNNFHMGSAGELCAKTHHFSREAQDAFALESFKRARDNQANGHFSKEIIPITVASKKGTETISTDESPAKPDLSKMGTLKPVFDKAGTITAANASSIADGAAACLVTSEDYARKNGIKKYFRILADATFAHQPEWFTTAPVGALKQLEKKSGININNWDAIEINEAFAVVPMVAIKELSLKPERVNPRGGAIALGHPIGCSGARLLATLTNHLEATGGRYGVATLCIGGGEAVAMLVERVS